MEIDGVSRDVEADQCIDNGDEPLVELTEVVDRKKEGRKLTEYAKRLIPPFFRQSEKASKQRRRHNS